MRRRARSTWASRGGDLIAESGAERAEPAGLGMGKCRLAICVPETARSRKPSELDGCRIATSFPNVTERYLDEHNADVPSGEAVRLAWRS